jgi:hypothetical protein
MSQLLDIGLDPDIIQDRFQFLPCKIAVTFKGFHDGGITLCKQRLIETYPPVGGREKRFQPWSRKFEHPSDILRHDEMPGRTHYVDTQNSAIVESPFDVSIGGFFYAKSQGPFCGSEILGLDSCKVGDSIHWAFERRMA